MDKGSNYVSPYTTENTKYTGPLAIVSFEGTKNAEHQMEGEGKVLFANGSTYVGSFRADMMHGKGILHGCEGSVYDGEFNDDARHGHGRFT